MKRSLYWRIMGAFSLLIFFTVILTTAVEYLSTRSELPMLLSKVRTENLAQSLGVSYAREKSWKMIAEEIGGIAQWEGNGFEDELLIRVVVRDLQGATIYNSFSDLRRRTDSPLVEGKIIPIYDFDSGAVVGSVSLYMSREYLDTETFAYILGILKPRFLQGATAILLALLTAVILTGKLMKPIKSLTEAALDISLEGVETTIPVESSDELGHMSEAFNQMILSLGKQREIRKKLIGDISHHIGTPLNVIRLEAKGLYDGLISPGEASVHIMAEVDTLSNLIHDLNWLAETDSGQFKLDRKEISISKVILSEVRRWQLKAQLGGISLKVQPLPSPIPLVNADEDRIGVVLSNLLDNAIKYTNGPGDVEVSCQVGPDFIRVSVSDTGPGINSDDLPYLFERFYRSDKQEAKEITGRGLGLAIVKQIVELHGGNVCAESIKGQGSVFRFTLPR